MIDSGTSCIVIVMVLLLSADAAADKASCSSNDVRGRRPRISGQNPSTSSFACFAVCLHYTINSHYVRGKMRLSSSYGLDCKG